MRYLDYNEKQTHTTNGFPAAYYIASRDTIDCTMPLHWHKEFEFGRILSGSVSFFIRDRWYQLEEGDCFFIMPGFLHGYRRSSYDLDCLVFSCEDLLNWSLPPIQDSISSMLNTIEVQSIFKPSDVQLYHYVYETLDLAGQGIGSNIYSIIGHLYNIFGWILEHHRYEKASDHSDVSFTALRLKKVFDYIDAHYGEPITINDLATCADMSPCYFATYFSSTVHRTPMDYVNFIRIRNARFLLQDPTNSITDVAFSCGFSSSSYFVKVFKKYENITPKQFQKKQLSNTRK